MKKVYVVYYNEYRNESKSFDNLASAILFGLKNMDNFRFINMVIHFGNDSTVIIREILTKRI